MAVDRRVADLKRREHAQADMAYPVDEETSMISFVCLNAARVGVPPLARGLSCRLECEQTATTQNAHRDAMRVGWGHADADMGDR